MFKKLTSLLNEAGDDNITSGIVAAANKFKAGYNAAADAHSKLQADQKSKDADAKSQQEKTKQATEKESLVNVKDDVTAYLEGFFDHFPYYEKKDGHLAPEDILQKYQTSATALVAFKAYRGLAERLDEQRSKFLAALVAAGKLTAQQVKAFELSANNGIKNQANPVIPADLISFVRSEAKFFKHLITVNDDFTLNTGDFRNLLSSKVNQTNKDLLIKAAKAMNLMLTYMVHELQAHARTIADGGRKLKASEDKQKESAPE